MYCIVYVCVSLCANTRPHIRDTRVDSIFICPVRLRKRSNLKSTLTFKWSDICVIFTLLCSVLLSNEEIKGRFPVWFLSSTHFPTETEADLAPPQPPSPFNHASFCPDRIFIGLFIVNHRQPLVCSIEFNPSVTHTHTHSWTPSPACPWQSLIGPR